MSKLLSSCFAEGERCSAEGKAESLRTIEKMFILRGLWSADKKPRDKAYSRGEELRGSEVFGSSAQTTAEHHGRSSFVNINN